MIEGYVFTNSWLEQLFFYELKMSRIEDIVWSYGQTGIRIESKQLCLLFQVIKTQTENTDLGNILSQIERKIQKWLV